MKNQTKLLDRASIFELTHIGKIQTGRRYEIESRV